MRTKPLINLLFLLPITFIVILFLSSAPNQSSAKQARSTGLILEELESGLDYPTYVTHAGDGTGRLFIVEQPGRIWIYKNGVQTEPFLDIRGRVRSPQSGGGSEEGLFSIAFPPGFGSGSSHFYIYYTNLNGDNQVSRFSLSGNPDRADASSEEIVLYLNHPTNTNHNGGQLAFGPDGYLYIGTGDGGGGGDPAGNAQDLTSLLGKLLRIDVEMKPVLPFVPTGVIYLPAVMQSIPAPQQMYIIPESNPFVDQAGARKEIWALGLRNPWRFSFDRQTNDLYIADVGQGTWEEVDYQSASSAGGENYGWSITEGAHCFQDPSCDPSIFDLPVHEYSHDDGCSITGGYVYRGEASPGLQGIYLFADFCSRVIWGLKDSGSGWVVEQLAQGEFNISSFGEDEDGELYLLYRSNNLNAPGTGKLIRIHETTN